LFTNKQTADIPSFLTYWERVKDEKSISAPEGENAVQIMTIHKSKGLQFPIVLIPFCTNKTDDTQLEKFWIPTQKPSMPYELASAKSSIYTEMSGEVAEIYQNLKHQTIFNAINLLYVAMTRAAKELYIFSKYTESKQGITFDQNSYPELLYNYLQHIGQWSEGQFKYTFGKNFVLKSKDKPVKNAMQLQFQPTNRNLSIATNAAFLWNDQLQDALLKGNRLHDMMADVWVKDDVVPALAKAIQKRKISEEEKEVYMAWVEKIVTHPLLSKYYEADWQTLNEQEISYNNELLRPDRIGINGNKAVIIDYKTGKPTQAHEQQINKYKLAVEDLGFNVKYQFLVYLDDHIEVVYVA
jgi:ATP-dependent exoDNAse (exonuclease V) beta subunit